MSALASPPVGEGARNQRAPPVSHPQEMPLAGQKCGTDGQKLLGQRGEVGSVEEARQKKAGVKMRG